MRLSPAEIDSHVETFNRDGMVMLRNHFAPEVLTAWREAFAPLLAAHIENEKDAPNRGSHRHYVTLPFSGLFADPAIHADPDVLAIVERVAGTDPVLCCASWPPTPRCGGPTTNTGTVTPHRCLRNGAAKRLPFSWPSTLRCAR